MATWSALSGGIWVTGRRVVAARCRQRWRVFRRFRTFLLRLDAIEHRPLQMQGDTRGRAATAPPPLLADRRKCIVYGRGIPYGERLHASRESALWQRRNARNCVHGPSPPSPRVYLSL